MSIASGPYIIECFYLPQIYEIPSNISYHREKSINFNDISSASYETNIVMYRIVKEIRKMFYMT